MILGPTLFNILISNLDGVIKCMLTKFVNGPELGGEMGISEVRATLWEDLERLEDWGSKNLNLKLNNDKCKIMYLEKYNNSLFIQESLVSKQLSMREHHAAVAKRMKKMLGCTNNSITSR